MQVHLKGGKQSLVWLKHRERKENPSIRRNYKEKEEITINEILIDGKLVGYKVNGERMTMEEFEKTGLVYKLRVNKVKSKTKSYKKRKKRHKKNKTVKTEKLI